MSQLTPRFRKVCFLPSLLMLVALPRGWFVYREAYASALASDLAGQCEGGNLMVLDFCGNPSGAGWFAATIDPFVTILTALALLLSGIIVVFGALKVYGGVSFSTENRIYLAFASLPLVLLLTLNIFASLL